MAKRIIRRLLACLALGAGVPALQAQPPAAELFFRPPALLDAKLSPSGERLALTANISGKRVGLFVWDLSRPGQSTAAAHFHDADVGFFEWVNDERLVYGLTDLGETLAEQRPPGLFSVQADGSRTRTLIQRDWRTYRVGGDPTRDGLSPRHRLLAVPPAGGQHVVVGEFNRAGNERVTLTPMRLNVATGESERLELDAPKEPLGWIFDGRAEPRVAITGSEGRRQLHWRPPRGTAWRQIAEGDWLRLPFTVAFADEQGQLYVTKTEGAARTHALARWDAATGRPEDKPLVRVPGFDFAGGPVRGDDGRVLGVGVDAETMTTVWFDPALKRLQQLADERWPGYVNLIRCRRCGAADMVALVRPWSDRDPGSLWLYQAAPKPTADGKPGPTWQLISRVRPGVDPRAMAEVDVQRIKARDGRELPVWITVPAGRKPDKTGAAVLLVHGGPWVRDGHWRWEPLQQFLASRGYVVISPDFRGSTGYGAAHYQAGFKQWGLTMQDDVADAARWAIAQGWADRVCIIGASYGGYSTLMGLVRDGDLYRCGAAWAAVTDPFLFLQGNWWVSDDISAEGREHALKRMVGDPKTDEARLLATSPLAQAARIRAPLLLAFGALDQRVPLAHGERLRSALRAAGNDPEWIIYPGEGHGWFAPETRIDFARRLEAFLAQHLAPR